MSSYTNGWTWTDGSTEEQRESVENAAHCDAIAKHIASIYHQIPDPESEQDCELRAEGLDAAFEHHYEKAVEENGGDRAKAHESAEAALKQVQVARQAETQVLWDQIEFFAQKLGERGARLKRAFEHWNEDEQRVRLQECAADSRDRE